MYQLQMLILFNCKSDIISFGKFKVKIQYSNVFQCGKLVFLIHVMRYKSKKLTTETIFTPSRHHIMEQSTSSSPHCNPEQHLWCPPLLQPRGRARRVRPPSARVREWTSESTNWTLPICSAEGSSWSFTTVSLLMGDTGRMALTDCQSCYTIIPQYTHTVSSSLSLNSKSKTDVETQCTQRRRELERKHWEGKERTVVWSFLATDLDSADQPLILLLFSDFTLQLLLHCESRWKRREWEGDEISLSCCFFFFFLYFLHFLLVLLCTSWNLHLLLLFHKKKSRCTLTTGRREEK